MNSPPASSLASRAQPASHRWADIQGLRGLAVTLVVLYHIGLPLPGGFTGVDMFFVISGYVIMESLLREYHSTGRIRFSQFFVRRFKRLFPALLLVVAVTVLLSLFFLPPLSNDNRALLTGIGAIFISANAVIATSTGDYFAEWSRINPLLHTWSLSVEEQFYLLFPLVVLLGFALGKRFGGAFRGLAWSIALVSAASFAVAILASRLDLPLGNTALGFYSPVPRAWEFGVGALLSLALRARSGPSGVAALGASLTGGVLITLSTLLIDSDTLFPSEWTLLPVLGTALLIYGGSSAQPHAVTRALSVSPAVWLGNISYSLYLWHWPLIVFASLAWTGSLLVTGVAALVSVAIAQASYRFIEQPLRVYPTPTAPTLAKYVVVVLVLPGSIVAVTAAVETVVLKPFLNDTVGQPLFETFSEDAGCMADEFDRAWADNCTWNAEASGKPIYLVGDSTATQLDEGLFLVAQELDRPLAVWTGIACLPLRQLTTLDDDGAAEPSHCPEFPGFLSTALSEAEPGTIILAFSDITQWRDWISYRVGDNPPLSDSRQKGAAIAEPLRDQIALFQSFGHEVITVYPIPNFHHAGEGYEPRRCTLWELETDQCAPEVNRIEMVTLQSTWRESVTRAASATDSRTIDLFDRYCNQDTCSPSRGLFLAYRDDFHISAQESRQLAPIFLDALTVGTDETSVRP